MVVSVGPSSESGSRFLEACCSPEGEVYLVDGARIQRRVRAGAVAALKSAGAGRERKCSLVVSGESDADPRLPLKRPPVVGQRGSAKRDRKAINLQMKLEVLRRFEAGEKLSRIGRALGLSTSTVATIRDNKDKIRASSQAATPRAAATLTRSRSLVMENMERLLGLWIEDQHRRHVPVSVVLVQEKARSLFEELKRAQGEGAKAETFGASRGWFARFKARHGLLGLGAAGEAVRADAGPARRYPALLRRVIQEGGYTARQVFKVDETRLFWRRLPGSTAPSPGEKPGPGLPAARDLLTLLLGSNAAGDFKLKPLLVYPSESPRALGGFSKPNLPVLWRSHRKARVTVSLFQEWFVHFFCPAVERYCAGHGLPYKALLVLDRAPGRPGNLDDLSDHVRVEYLPKDTTTLIQPMTQDVVATFKACYLRRVFCLLAARAGGAGEQSAALDFWRDYSILDAVYNISESWEEVPSATLNGGWRKLWPECLQHDACGPHVESLPQIRREVVSLAHRLGFREVAEVDVVELLQSQGADLSNEELVGLEQQRAAGAEGEDSSTVYRQLTARHLAEALAHFDAGLQIVRDNDPNLERSLRVCRGVNSVISCYRELFKEKRGPS
ncbi:tigger transposable element-derived protein 1-like [Hippopotamus amphibius kiboko]|uniref:tigger transposable element-derived protein 1-like n=1 Tax=Hippopotamus amphibius kiboko TaxID=575201 RepID=UPI002592254B|nr:tigger transposable element-derived protein 1-like [Hippopotamus amphibius kiboko]